MAPGKGEEAPERGDRIPPAGRLVQRAAQPRAGAGAGRAARAPPRAFRVAPRDIFSPREHLWRPARPVPEGRSAHLCLLRLCFGKHRNAPGRPFRERAGQAILLLLLYPNHEGAVRQRAGRAYCC